MIHIVEKEHGVHTLCEADAGRVAEYTTGRDYKYMEGSIQNVDCQRCRELSWAYTEACVAGEHTQVELLVYSDSWWHDSHVYAFFDQDEAGYEP